MKKIIIALGTVILLSLSSAALGKALRITIYGPGEQKIALFVAKPLSLTPSFYSAFNNKLYRLIQDKFKLFPFLTQLSSKDVLEGGQVKGVTLKDIDFKKFFLSKVDLLITIGLGPSSKGLARIELRAFDVFKQTLLTGKAFILQSPNQLEMVARIFAAAVLKKLSGYSAFFDNPIVFVARNKGVNSLYEVYADGFGLKKLFDLKGILTSPCWSFDRKRIVFSAIKNNRNFLGVLDLVSHKVEYHKLPGTLCISPVFTPQGNIAVSLSLGQDPDIFLLDKNFKVKKALVQHWGIDISPFFDQKGDKMVFTSSRFGNPQIFLLNLENKQVQRVTYEGNYNTSAVISPDGRLIVYSRLTPNGHRIFVHDLNTGLERQITFGPGNDEEPFVSSDGYFVLFTSNRSGRYQLYYTTINGDGPYLIPTQGLNGFVPAWSWDKK